ncbi:MAG: hypothetical protein ACI91B_001464 [Planctomycetota bacterium]|jgi:hypothetical protein
MRLSAALTTLLLATAMTAQDPLDDLPGLDDQALGGDGETGLRVTGLRGFLETRGRYFIKDHRTGDNRKDGQWIQELELEIDFTLSDSVTGYFRPRFLIDAIDDDLVRTEPLEAYLTWSSPGNNFDIRAGQLIENWGIADTFNPVDVINRRDLAEDVLDPARLGELGARARWKLPSGDTIGEPILSVYALPTHRKTSFPTRRNRFSFATPPNELLEDAGTRPSGFDRWFLALRGQATVSTDPANADVQFVAARGPDRFPLFAQSIASGGGTNFVPSYYGMWTVGGGVRAVPNYESLAAYTLKAEVVYKVPYNFSDQSLTLPDEYLQYAIGFDRVIPNVFTDKDQITATLEWVGETGANDSTSVFRPFDDDLVVRAFWEANDFARTSIELRGFADPNKQEYLVEGIYQRQLRSIHEDLQLELGMRWFDVARSEPGFFNLFPNNSSVWMSFRLAF